MSFKVERVDSADSFYTTFMVYSTNNSVQEFNIPVWDADEFENKVKIFTNTEFKGYKDKEGKKVARDSR